MYTIGTAAKATGKAKSTISKALKSGKISGRKDENGQYQIDPAELHRVFPPVSEAVHVEQKTISEAHKSNGNNDLLGVALRSLENERDYLRGLLEEEKARHQETRDKLTATETKYTALLEAPEKKKRWWQF